jgi:anthranilate synthase/aminodeoxychorismate synthase-like glutamine amidotransferase
LILFIDNYDSFVYNLVQYVGERSNGLKVVRPDDLTVDQVADLNPQRIVISPGPGHPDDAKLSVEVVRRFYERTPILGICLGHQCVAAAFGATVGPAERLVHGKTSEIYHRDRGILAGLPNPFVATRYHSLAVVEETLPPELQVLAYTSDGEIMGLMHKEAPLFGLQFHPESILTREGKRIINAFLDLDVCSTPYSKNSQPAKT